MRTLILTYFVLGLLLYLAVWWATDAAAQGDWQLCRPLQPSPMVLQLTGPGHTANDDRLSRAQLRCAVRIARSPAHFP